MTALIKMAELW